MEPAEFRRASHAVWEAMAPGWEREYSWFEEHARPVTERMVEALEIEGKRFEVHWYDDEGHGWERRENRRDAFERILKFLRTHMPPEGSR